MTLNRKITTAMQNGENMDAVLEVLMEGAAFGGIPAKTVKNYYEAITDISEGNTEHPFLRAFGWTKYGLMED